MKLNNICKITLIMFLIIFILAQMSYATTLLDSINSGNDDEYSSPDSVELTEETINNFNKKFEDYEGTITGTKVKNLIDDVYTNNSSQTNDKLKVEISGVITLKKTDKEKPSTTNIDTSAKYEVKFTKTDKIISKIEITKDESSALNTNTNSNTNTNANTNANTNTNSNSNTSGNINNNTNSNSNNTSKYNSSNNQLSKAGIEDYQFLPVVLVICVISILFAIKKLKDYQNI